MAKLNDYLSRVLSGNDPRLKVNLKKMFQGLELPDSSQFREVLGQAIIDRIRERTLDNIDRDGKRFRNYSKEYAASIGFVAAGKDKSDPNLKRSGDMLSFLTVTDQGDGFIEIGWDDSDEAAKAHGHITGNIGVKRDFLGLPKREIESIAIEIESELPDEEIIEKQRSTLSEFTFGARTVGPGKTFDELLDALFIDED